jgi:hypothetical protein
MPANVATVSLKSLLRALEVENNRNEASISRLLSNGLQNGFALRGEPADYQHGFRRDGAEHVANLLVLAEQDDELRDFRLSTLGSGCSGHG